MQVLLFTIKYETTNNNKYMYGEFPFIFLLMDPDRLRMFHIMIPPVSWRRLCCHGDVRWSLVSSHTPAGLLACTYNSCKHLLWLCQTARDRLTDAVSTWGQKPLDPYVTTYYYQRITQHHTCVCFWIFAPNLFLIIHKCSTKFDL